MSTLKGRLRNWKSPPMSRSGSTDIRVKCGRNRERRIACTAKTRRADTYARLTISSEFYENAIYRAKTVLLTVLASLYVLAVLLLETVIMPRYVYRPIPRHVGGRLSRARKPKSPRNHRPDGDPRR